MRRTPVVVAALIAALISGAARAQDLEPKPPPKIDAKLDGSAAAGGKTVSFEVHYPSAEKDGKRWAETVKAVIEKGLPALAKAAGFDPPRDRLEVRFAFGPQDTDGYDAALKGDKLFVRKATARKEPGMYRAGYRGHWVLYSLARLWTDHAVRPEWLRAGLAHLLVYQTLKERPSVYHARTYRDEILFESTKLEEGAGPLDQWMPAPPGGAAAEQPTPLPQAARALGHLYQIDVLFDGAVRKAVAEIGATGESLKTKEFIDVVLRASGGKATVEHFAGWAWADPAGPALVPKLDRTDLIDSDGDGLLNFEETLWVCDKSKPDSDGDGIPDGEEVEDGTDPKSKNRSRAPVRLDGDGTEWKRLKAMRVQDKPNDAKEGIRGADVKAYKLCADKKNLYVLIEADAFDNLDVAYQFQLDAADDGVPIDSRDPDEQRKVVWNYIIGFRGDGSLWLQDTRNSPDASWHELKNHRRMALAIKGTVAELRIPLDALELPPRFLVSVYTTAKDGKLQTDTVLRQVVDLEKWRH